MNDVILQSIKNHLSKARKKHPIFCKSTAEMVCLLVEEVGEMAQSINDCDQMKAKIEALDCIAVLVRFLEND